MELVLADAPPPEVAAPPVPVSLTPSLAAVAGPTMPSGESPCFVWKSCTAYIVCLPYIPSTAPL